MTVPSPAQCRAARALLDWRQDDLSKRSGVSKRSIAAYELEQAKLMRANLTVIRQALEEAGIEFREGGWLRLKPTEPSK